MKRILRTVAGFTILLMLALLMTGCVSIEMKVNDNGSCELKYEIETKGLPIEFKDVKKQIEETIEAANDEAGKKVIKLKSIKEKKDKITADVTVENVSYIDSGAYFGKLSDFEEEFPNTLDYLWDAKNDDMIETEDIKGASKLNVVKVAGLDNEGMLTKLVLTLPGSVKYISSEVTLIDDNTVEIAGGYGVVVYQRGGGAGWLIYVLIIVVIVAVAVIVFKVLGKNKVATAAPAVASASVIHCPHCNVELKSDVKFCSSCGGGI
jgi:hypothetical protein